MPKITRPRRNVNIFGPAWAHGGTENWAYTFAEYMTAEGYHLKNVYVTNPELNIRRRKNQDPIHALTIPPSQIHAKAEEAEVNLFWGIELDNYIDNQETTTNVLIAHGASWWQQQIASSSVRSTTATICVSDDALHHSNNGNPRYLVTNCINPKHIIQTRAREDIRAGYGFEERDFIVGYVGRLTTDKRLDLFVEAIQHQPAHVKGLIIGRGENEDQLKALADTLAPNRIQFDRMDEALGNAYAGMDAFFNPSEHEGFGLATAEAMFHELPVVTRRIGLAREDITHCQNGIIWDEAPTEINDILNWLDRLRGRGGMIGKAARRTAEKKYLPDLWAKRMATTIDEILERRG